LTGLIPTLPTLVFKIYHVYIGTAYVVNEENYAMEEECLESERGDVELCDDESFLD
jgi:hypothetical protein